MSKSPNPSNFFSPLLGLEFQVAVPVEGPLSVNTLMELTEKAPLTEAPIFLENVQMSLLGESGDGAKVVYSMEAVLDPVSETVISPKGGLLAEAAPEFSRFKL
jgi:hypothetical protein